MINMMSDKEIEKIFKEGVHIQVLQTLRNYRATISEDLLTKYADTFDNHHWRIISMLFKLSESFIENFSDRLYWKDLVQTQNLSMDFIIKHIEKINLFYIAKKQKLSEDFIVAQMEKLNMVDVVKHPLSESFLLSYWDTFSSQVWEQISISQTLSEEMIERFSNSLYWEKLCKHQVLSEDFIKKHIDKVSFEHIFQYQKLSKSFIDKFYVKADEYWTIITIYQKHLLYDCDFVKQYADKIDWSEVCDHCWVARDNEPNIVWRILDENLIDEIAYKLGEKGWKYVAMCEVLSESFIEKYLKLNCLSSPLVTYNQNISESFIDKMHEYLDWDSIGGPNHKLSESFIEKWEDKVNWTTICENQMLSEPFMNKFNEKLDWRKVAQNQIISPKFAFRYMKLLNVELIKESHCMTKKQINDVINTIGVVQTLA